MFKYTSTWKYMFYIHIAVQALGLIVGIAGVALGSQLEVTPGEPHSNSRTLNPTP